MFIRKTMHKLGRKKFKLNKPNSIHCPLRLVFSFDPIDQFIKPVYKILCMELKNSGS